MCLGIPGLVVEQAEPEGDLAMALVEFSGLRRKVCVACVPDCVPGDYVIVHAGIAISRVDPDEAVQIGEALAAAGEMDGWDDDRVESVGGSP